MLSQTLKKLERDGLVERRAFPTVPVTVEYELTPLGRTLTRAAGGPGRLGGAPHRTVLAAQQQYGAAQAG